MSLTQVTRGMRERLEMYTENPLPKEMVHSSGEGRIKVHKCALCGSPYSRRDIAVLCFGSCKRIVERMKIGNS